jgi:hypothetical protein
MAEPNVNDFLKIKVGMAVIEVNPGFNKNLLVDVVEALVKIC